MHWTFLAVLIPHTYFTENSDNFHHLGHNEVTAAIFISTLSRTYQSQVVLISCDNC